MDLEAFGGPYGGMMAVAYGFGAVSGYGFALKKHLSIYKERIA